MLYSTFVKEKMAELKAKGSKMSAPEKMKHIAGEWRKQSNKSDGGMLSANGGGGRHPRQNAPVPAGPALPVAVMHHTQISALMTPAEFGAFQATHGIHNFYNQNIAHQFIQQLHQPHQPHGQGLVAKSMKKPKKDAILQMFGVEELRPRLKNKKAMKKILNTVEKFTVKPPEDECDKGSGLKEGFMNTHKLLKWGLGLPEPENYVASGNTLGF